MKAPTSQELRRNVARVAAALGGAALFVAFGVPAHASAYCRLTTIDPPLGQLCSTEGRPLKWTEPNTTIALLPRDRQDIPAETIELTIQHAFDTWSEVSCGGTSVRIVADLQSEPATETMPDHHDIGSNENVIMFVDSRVVWSDRMNVPNALGLTSVFHSKKTGRIVGADMEINDWRGTLGVCGSDCPLGVTDLENVLTHEAGHYYGLGHVNDAEATMFAQASEGETHKRDLAADDIAGICAIYPSAFEDDGCGCAVAGAHDDDRRGVLWSVAFLLPLLLRLRSRARRATEIRRAHV